MIFDGFFDGGFPKYMIFDGFFDGGFPKYIL